MAHYFISDLHIDKSKLACNKALLAFIASIKSDAKALYILGDFVEYWVGDDDTQHGLDNIFEALKSLSQTCPVYLMHGNRDFLIGQEFASEYNLTLIPDPYLIEINGQAILLTHGDLLCTDDQDYLEFRKLVRSEKWQTEFLAKELIERLTIADSLREQSKLAMQNKADNLMDTTSETVEHFFKYYKVPYIIHGHTHRPAIHEHLINNKNCKRIVLSDWHDRATYLKINENRLEFVTENKEEKHQLSS